MNAVQKPALRLRYAKNGKIRFTSHRDVARVWERVLRRVAVPVAYSEGYSPRPRISFGLALSTGSVSDAEYIDVILEPGRPQPCPLEDLPRALNGVLPVGLQVTGIADLSPSAISLQQAVTSCSWEFHIMNTTHADTNAWAETVREAESIVVTRERKGKEVIDDLRPSINSLEVADTKDPRTVSLRAELCTQPRALRPSEFLAVLEPPFSEYSVRRTNQWIEWEGARRDPLEVSTTNVVAVSAGAAPVPRTMECVG